MSDGNFLNEEVKIAQAAEVDGVDEAVEAASPGFDEKATDQAKEMLNTLMADNEDVESCCLIISYNTPDQRNLKLGAMNMRNKENPASLYKLMDTVHMFTSYIWRTNIDILRQVLSATAAKQNVAEEEQKGE